MQIKAAAGVFPCCIVLNAEHSLGATHTRRGAELRTFMMLSKPFYSQSLFTVLVHVTHGSKREIFSGPGVPRLTAVMMIAAGAYLKDRGGYWEAAGLRRRSTNIFNGAIKTMPGDASIFHSITINLSNQLTQKTQITFHITMHLIYGVFA